jgi:ABC-type polysaccharide transport system permease subunit
MNGAVPMRPSYGCMACTDTLALYTLPYFGKILTNLFPAMILSHLMARLRMSAAVRTHSTCMHYLPYFLQIIPSFTPVLYLLRYKVFS